MAQQTMKTIRTPVGPAAVPEGNPRRCRLALGVAVLLVVSPALLRAQGILTVTPSRGVTTSAGTGGLGYTGDGGAAFSATLASPSAVAYDANGNLYLADAGNHVVREILKSGQISTIAGTGIEGYGGDGAAATSAYLDTPTGVAVDGSGNVYIADSHNHRIRKVSGGTITTVAGTGLPGYSGDGGLATAAELWLPSAVALDGAGNVYIADTNNQRIRKITVAGGTGPTIATLAGDGEELFAGDGAAATSAVLDSPTGVALDASGNVYIADRHNQRVRMVASGGTISTLAGSGTASFAGGFAGDGASATAATLAKPSGVSVDAAGNVYIADTGNQRIRELGGGVIATVVGSAAQGYGGDGGAATGAILNSPKAVALDASGNLTVPDKLNQRLRAAPLPALTFANDGVGIQSAAQSVTLANSGSASIAVAAMAFTGAFTAVTGGSCSAPPIALAASASCTQDIAFLPVAPGAASGSVAFSGAGVVPESILLVGTGVQTATTVTLASSVASPFAGEAVTFTATVKPTGVGTPTGSVSFYDGVALLGSSTLTAGSATIATALIAGTHTLTAVYAGDANFTGSTSAVLTETVSDFSFTLGAGSPGSQTVEPGQTATYVFNLLPVGVPFPLPLTLSATGLPPGATVVFTPETITLGASPASFTMAIQTAASGASIDRKGPFGYGDGAIALGLLLLPFSRRLRSKTRGWRPFALCAALVLSLAAIAGLAGCGTGSGFFGQPQQSYTVTVNATATGAGGVTLMHSTTVTLTVQ